MAILCRDSCDWETLPLASKDADGAVAPLLWHMAFRWVEEVLVQYFTYGIFSAVSRSSAAMRTLLAAAKGHASDMRDYVPVTRLPNAEISLRLIDCWFED